MSQDADNGIKECELTLSSSRRIVVEKPAVTDVNRCHRTQGIALPPWLLAAAAAAAAAAASGRKRMIGDVDLLLLGYGNAGTHR
jgi:hypothetical protein